MDIMIGLIFGAVAVIAAFRLGQKSGKDKEQAKRVKSELDAHDRINDADTGGGATDAERAKRLRDFASGNWNSN